MKCERWNDDWIATLYGELDEVDERELRQHLQGCSACVETLGELGRSRDDLREASPAVPPAPRVVVLQSSSSWRGAGSFAAGLAAATLVFSVGLVVGARFSARPAERDPIARNVPAALEGLEKLDAIDARLARLEAGRDQHGGATQPVLLTEAGLRDEFDKLERRLQGENEQALAYLLRSMTATELRTETRLSRTQDTLQYLALRQDPRFTEH